MSTDLQIQSDLIRSSRFRSEREKSWKELEDLVVRAEKGGAKSLSYKDVTSLASLYRQAMNSLSLARAISMDKALEVYLSALCARAYLVVYAPQETIRGVVGKFLSQRVPQTIRRNWLSLLIGFLALFLGAIAGFVLASRDPEWFFTFVPGGLSDGRVPGASVGYLRDTLFDKDISRDGELGVFATFLFSHNTQIAILTFALGVFALLPSFLLIFSNGLMVGAFYSLFYKAGLGIDAFGWLSIHGVTELGAIGIACAGGARLGLAVVSPGQDTIRESLRKSGRDAVTMVILAGLMLIVAAGIEGYLRQLIQSTPWRLAIGWGVGLTWLSWFVFGGRGGVEQSQTDEPA